MTTNIPLMEWTPDRIKRFWDWQSQFPEEYFTVLFGPHIVSHFSSLLAGKDVLDLGCGPGGLLPHLCSVARSVTGADLSEASVAAANARCQGAPGFSGAHTIGNLQKDRASFDVIFSVEVVEHLDDDSLAALLSTAHGLLKPGGRFIVTTPNDENLSKSYMYSPATNELYHRWQHMRSWNSETLPQRLTAAGFRVETTYATNLAMQGHTRDALLRRFIHYSNRLRGRGSPQPPHLICVVTRN